MSVLKNRIPSLNTVRRLKLMGLLGRAEDFVNNKSSSTNTAAASASLLSRTRTMMMVDADHETNNVNYIDPIGFKKSDGLTLQSLFEKQSYLISSYINKIKDSGHPILQVESDLFEESSMSYYLSPSVQLRAIIVLLVANSMNPHSSFQRDELIKLKLLSEITEMMHTAFILHRTIVNVKEQKSPLHHGNKLATLMGDLLLAKSTKKLSQLLNNPVVELMCETITDFGESEMIGTPSANGGDHETGSLTISFPTWIQRNTLGLGSLLGNSCKSTMVLTGGDSRLQNYARMIGTKIGLLLQGYTDLKFFEREDNDDGYTYQENLIQPSILLTLPVVHALENNPSLISMAWNPSYPKLHEIYRLIQSSPTAIMESKRTLRSIHQDISKLLADMEDSRASEILKHILHEISEG